jgi:hypothetical protein
LPTEKVLRMENFGRWVRGPVSTMRVAREGASFLSQFLNLFPKDEPSEEAPMELGLKDPEEGTLPFPTQSLR